jgi:hypothetical protein
VKDTKARESAIGQKAKELGRSVIQHNLLRSNESALITVRIRNGEVAFSKAKITQPRGKRTVETGKVLLKNNWDEIFGLRWTTSRRSLLERIKGRQSQPMFGREFDYSAVEAINNGLRNAHLPYRLRSDKGSGNWRDRPMRMVHVE